MHLKKIKTVIFKIDGKNMKTRHGDSLLQACFKAYIDIPRFCYHEGLRIAGNCRMCLVEVANSKKLIASCATPLVSSFAVFTKTFRVKRARQAILEFLLINHPLDCPICDQGGECDLQDITLIFGGDRGRFYEISKRAVFDKNFGPLIKTVMNRCIHCTRCVRFFEETSVISKTGLGLLGRGSSTEIGTYMPSLLLTEFSGNVIDLCPVGALTSKPFAFKARTWELYSQYTYDILDCTMPRVKFDLTGKNVLRVLPYMGVYNSGWINNRTRFCYDALNLQKHTSCLWNFSGKRVQTLSIYKMKSKKVFVNITWKDAFSLLLKMIINNLNTQISSFMSGLACLEHVWIVKQFFQSIGNHNLFFEDIRALKNVDVRSTFVIDMPLNLLNDNLWHVLLMGVNLRMEAPLLFLQMKKMYNKGFIEIYHSASSFMMHPETNVQLGVSSKNVFKLFEGRSNKVRLLVNGFLYYRYLILINFELSYSHCFSLLLSLFERFFQMIDVLHKYLSFNALVDIGHTYEISTKNIWCGVVQRYVGNISLNEIGLGLNYYNFLNNIISSKKKTYLNFFFDVTTHTQEHQIRRRYDTSLQQQSILFNSSISDISSLADNIELVVPVKGVYEEEQSFLDAFLSHKTSRKIIPENNQHKNLQEVFRALHLYLNNVLREHWLVSFFTYLQDDAFPTFHVILPEISSTSLYKFTEKTSFLSLVSPKGSRFFFEKFARLIMFFKYVPFFMFTSYPLNLIVNTQGNIPKFDMGVLPVLNFYKDDKINLICFSKTMRQSSFLFETDETKLSFGLYN